MGTITDDGLVVCDCGTVHDEASELLAEQRVRIHDDDDQMAKYRRKISTLTKDQYAKLTASPFYERSMVVLRNWQEKCMPSAKELETERLKITIARFQSGETEDRLIKCVHGYSCYPYVVNGRRCRSGAKDCWYADVTTIFRPGMVDKGIRLSDLEAEYERVFEPIEDANLSPAGQTALRCIGLGWKVFPCLRGEKAPATVHGLLDATGDRDRVIAYWTKVPDANLAIRTGQESGLIVLDVDGEEGYSSLHELEAKMGKMPATLSVVTPSGGQHFYFKHPGHEVRNTASVVAPGIDIRGDGGYVLAPPSKVGNRTYELDEESDVADMPEWLVTELLDYQVRLALRGKGQWAEMIEKGVTAGQRNQQMTSLVGKLVHAGLTSEQVAVVAHSLNRSHCKPPLQAREIDRVVESILKREARRVS
jgi:hypothetical protein